MPYGFITPTDAAILERGLTLVMDRFRNGPVRVVEVGVYGGDTSRGIEEFIRRHGRQIEYWGVDSCKDRQVVAPFEGAQLILGDSAEVYMHAPEDIHFLFLDGCHCVNHVMLDFLHYGDRLVSGGVVVFHDVSPRAQGKLDYHGHGPANHPDFGTASREALRKLGLLHGSHPGWAEEVTGWDDRDTGGAALYRKC